MKAAFLYNFAKFVEWPPERGPVGRASLDLCVLGADPFGEVLDRTVAGKLIGESKVSVRRLSGLAAVERCAVLFVSASERDQLDGVLEALHGMPVLTVSDIAGFAEAGGMIGMFIESNRVRFKINPEAAAAAHITISSRLLSLAMIVRTRRKGGT